MTTENTLPGIQTLGTPPAAGSVHAGRQKEPVLVDGSTPEWALDVFVPGQPAPQGSVRAINHRHTGRAVVIKANNATQKTWRGDIRDQVITRWDHEPLDGPVRLDIEFVMRRPTSLPKRRPTPPAIKRPDQDKLYRAVCDALTSAGVYRDDAQVIDSHITKRYAEIGETSGALIRVAVAVIPAPRRAQL